MQVFYHLGELDDALTYALGAGSLFDVNEQSEYVQTLVGARAPGGAGRGPGARLRAPGGGQRLEGAANEPLG